MINTQLYFIFHSLSCHLQNNTNLRDRDQTTRNDIWDYLQLISQFKQTSNCSSQQAVYV